ncbi:MAG: TIM barrel protein [Paludisphaera borealis]|uniref:sugar phosphate isomerase/epimerase family protein n=1 Tax=Paludisphaera borealis TaxID=1387353 RepID=UPI00284EC1E3|nr:TIM barrel protein [Paludisphaera borealis]MDR3621129.1 TIM barrel protein [Paludisphaera borealis]
MQLGTVTYNIAKDWDLPTIIKTLGALGYEGVELRTTHAHGVEVGLNAGQRAEVRKRFEDSPVQLAGLGSAFEYQAVDPAVVRKNVEGTKEYVLLAHDVGSPGVKVRPNGIPAGANLDQTLRQIGRALHEVGEHASGFGVEIRVEVHGAVTSELRNLAKIIEYADHPNVYVCWNSNPSDVVDGSIKETFALVAPKIREVHLRDLFDAQYPWRELFALLAGQQYDGFTLAEIPESRDPERVLRYFRALWTAYQPKVEADGR